MLMDMNPMGRIEEPKDREPVVEFLCTDGAERGMQLALTEAKFEVLSVWGFHFLCYFFGQFSVEI